MFRKTLIALAATGALAAASASAQAHGSRIIVGFGGGWYDSGYGGVSDGGYDPGCGYTRVTYKRWNWDHTYFRLKTRLIAKACY